MMTAVLQAPIESTFFPKTTGTYSQSRCVQSHSLISHLSAIGHLTTEQSPTTTNKASCNITLPGKIQQHVELIPYAGTTVHARDYVFLGSCEMPIVSNMGMTLDDTGRLVLIAGQCRDAISGLYHKLLQHDDSRYYVFSELEQPLQLRFDHLHVNENGTLLGRIRNSEHYYRISIDKNLSYHTAHKVQNTVSISYEKCDIRPEKNFMFHDKSGHLREISCKEGYLFITSDEGSNADNGIGTTFTRIASTLDNKYHVVSIKRAKDLLQIATVKQKKQRVFYLDPKNISNRDFSAKDISHKPPQSFYSCLGGDVHEKYYSGQPFSSRRISNFSSAHIPLISGIIDNIRRQTKKSKASLARGKKRSNSLSHLAKTIDPGIRAVVSATQDIARSKKHPNDNVLGNTVHNKSPLMKTCESLLKELPDSVANEKSYTGIADLLRHLATYDSMTFSNVSEFSIFFSLLQSGMPFNSGWFAGLIVAFAKTHSMTLSKTESGNIRLSFLNKRKTSCSLLAGTGQGLESGKVASHNINLLSIVPFDANAIISAYKHNEMSFSLDMTEAQFQHFLGHATLPDSPHHCPPISPPTINHVKERGGAFSIDMKTSELRAMIGIRPDANVNLLVPRFTSTLTFNHELISVKHKKEYKAVTPTSPLNKVSSDTTLRAFNATGGYSVAGKVIVSPSMPNASGKLGLRLALLDESNGKKIKIKSGFKITSRRSTAANIPSDNHRQIARIERILASMDTKGDVVRPIRFLRRIKVTRPLHLKRNPFQARLTTPFTKTQHPSHNRLSRVLKGHSNKGQIIQTLEKIRSHARQTRRASMNKRFNHYFVAKYTLNEEYQKQLDNLKNELTAVAANPEGINGFNQRARLTQLYSQARRLKKGALYRLDTIEIKSIGEISKCKASLLNIIVSFKNSKTLTYTKHLGEIQFEYENQGDKIPQTITGNYSFL